MKWRELSIPERAEYIRLGVKDGITSLDTIRETYNSYAGGGTVVRDAKTGEEIRFDTRQEANDYISSNYSDPNFYQGELPELIVTARKPSSLLEQGAANFEETFGITPRDAASFIPYIGDALDVKDIKDNLEEGSYSEAGLGALMLLLPNIIEKPLRYVGKGVRKLVHGKNSELRDALEEALSSNFYTNSPSSTRSFEEVKSPNVMVHADRGNGRGAYTKHGSYTEDELLKPGKAREQGQRDFTWFNQSEPYSLNVNGEPMERVFIGEYEDIPGLARVRDMDEPVGQWPGKSIKSKSFVKRSEYVTPEPVPLSNLVQYNLDPFEYSIGNVLYVKQGQPIMRKYGSQDYSFRDMLNTRQGYITQGRRQHPSKLSTLHYKEDITDPLNPILSGPVNDMSTKIEQSAPKIKEITNWLGDNKGTYIDDFVPSEYITIHNGELGKVIGEYQNLSLDPSRVVQSVKLSQLYDNKNRFMSTNPNQYIFTDYFHIPLTLWHRYGGKLKVK